jgi:transposase
VLVIIYHMLQQQKSYEELGGTYFDERERQAIEKRLVCRLEKMGYQVALQPAPQGSEEQISESLFQKSQP